MPLLVIFIVSLAVAASTKRRELLLRKAITGTCAWCLFAVTEMPGFFDSHNINLNRPDAWKIVLVAWLIYCAQYAAVVFAACGIVWLLCRKPTTMSTDVQEETKETEP